MEFNCTEYYALYVPKYRKKYYLGKRIVYHCAYRYFDFCKHYKIAGSK